MAMTPAEEARWYHRGAMTVLSCVLLFGILAYFASPWFGLPIAVLVAGWEWICRRRWKRIRESLDAAFEAAFQSFPGARPTWKQSSSYGFPSFSVCFSTKDDMLRAFASGHAGAFRSAIVRLFGYDGFDISKAFEMTYRGWEKDFAESLEIDPTGNTWLEERARLSGRGEQESPP